jgi:hypothetical protein
MQATTVFPSDVEGEDAEQLASPGELVVERFALHGPGAEAAVPIRRAGCEGDSRQVRRRAVGADDRGIDVAAAQT